MCYSPTNSSPESEITEFYEALGQTVQAVPLHSMLMIGGDFNAPVSQGFSYHDNNNRNGQYLIDFTEEFNILIGNTSFQKLKNKLWTWKLPTNDLSQIDFCLYRKHWRNSITNCQAYALQVSLGVITR